MKVLSLFDGISCGMVALERAGIPVERYVAYEIDKDAIRTAQQNYPQIEQRGDVFKADFTEFRGFDGVIGGSPCTYWSIAQTNNRETEARGFGWELFSQYVRAIEEAKPRFFIYENNKSMSKQIEDSITQTFGFPPICIDSARVSAQKRLRLYWVGVRKPDGTYRKVEISQPNDVCVYMDDILTAEDFAPYNGGKFIRMKPDLTEHYDANWQIGRTGKSGGQAVRVYDIRGKAVTLKSQAGGGGAKTGLYLYDGKVWSLSKTGAAKIQTIPSTYQFPLTDQKAISLMGNGWTVDVIAHIFAGLKTQAMAEQWAGEVMNNDD